MLRLATIGDRVTCNFPPYIGVIITGSNKLLHEGKPVARIGDLALCGGRIVTLVQGDPKLIVEGRPAHRITMLNSDGGITLP